MENRTVQTRAALLRANSIDTEKRTAQFVISTEAVDSYGTVFRADGWQLQRYNDNPVVFYNHNSHSSDPDAIIGTSRVFLENNQLIGELTLEPAEDNPTADKVWRKIKNGTLRGASIHAYPSEARWGEKSAGEDPDVLYFTRQELLEWSVVSIPSNPEALKRNAAAVDEIKKALQPKNEERSTNNEQEHNNKEMSRFDAQLIINQNL